MNYGKQKPRYEFSKLMKKRQRWAAVSAKKAIWSPWQRVVLIIKRSGTQQLPLKSSWNTEEPCESSGLRHTISLLLSLL